MDVTMLSRMQFAVPPISISFLFPSLWGFPSCLP